MSSPNILFTSRPAKRQKTQPAAGRETVRPIWLKNAEKQLDHCARLGSTLDEFSERVKVSGWSTPGPLRSVVGRTTAVSDVLMAVHDMVEWRPQMQATNEVKENERLSETQKMNRCQSIIKEFETERSGRPSQQSQFLNAYVETLVGGKDVGDGASPPRMVLLHGRPGTGKSRLIKAFREMCRVCGRYCIIVAPNMLYPNCDLAVVPETAEQETVKRLRNSGLDSNSAVIFDSVESVACWHLARIDRLCKIANCSSQPFGGCTVLLFGDFGMLPAVRSGLSLTQSVMDTRLPPNLHPGYTRRSFPSLSARMLSQNASAIMTSLRWYELDQQAEHGDKIHADLVEKMYKSGTVHMQDLRDNGYGLLVPNDATDTEWIKAPVLVATCREVYTMTDLRAKDFALHTNQPMIRWLCHRDPETWRNRPAEQHLADATEDPCFYEIFVKGAEGYLRNGYLKHLGLGAGTKIRYNSLLFSDKHQSEVKERLHCAGAGEVITLPFPPVAIFVEVLGPELADEESENALFSFSLSQNRHKRPIVPIYPCNAEWSSLVPIQGGDGYEASKVRVRPLFPLESAFAMTFHKASGRKLQRVVLALYCNDVRGCFLSYSQLYAGLSAVASRSQIRLLLEGNDARQRWESLSYIELLRPNLSAAYYFSGFKERDASRPNSDWTTDEWSEDRANKWIRRQGT